MADENKLVEQFKGIAGVDTERAKFFLEASGWNLETALGSFYESNEDPDHIDVDVPLSAGSDNVQSPPNQPPAAAMPPPPPRGASMPRIDAEDMSNSSSEEEEEDEGRQAFYAGGSQHSGQQVLGPSKKKKNVVSSLFKSAKKHGAEVVEGEKGGKSGSTRINFGGTGYRLGETETDHEVIPGSASKKEDKPRDVVLGMWKEGFTVDNGVLRRYDDPSNMEFLNSVRRGQIPLELLREAKGGEVYINMEDHRHEEYVVPKQNLKAFSGAGHSLGSPCPTVIGQVTKTGTRGGATGTSVVSAKPVDLTATEAKAKEELNLDSNEPSTNIQLRLPDGSRLILKANHSHTVGDIRRYVSTARPGLKAPFAIMMTFPHEELKDDSKSLSEANILNSALVIKPK